jgi:hypothetical protein
MQYRQKLRKLKKKLFFQPKVVYPLCLINYKIEEFQLESRVLPPLLDQLEGKLEEKGSPLQKLRN